MGMQTVRVTFDSGLESSKSYIASVVGTDPSRDLAVLQVDADPAELVPMSVGTSEDLRVGQYVYAIGNPSGLSKTQTNGVVSGLNRSIPSPTGLRIPGAIQTDAAISAGTPSINLRRVTCCMNSAYGSVFGVVNQQSCRAMCKCMNPFHSAMLQQCQLHVFDPHTPSELGAEAILPLDH